MTDTILLAILVIPCLVVAIVFHEVAHGLVANMLGDPTAKMRGRLTFNPIKHVDPIGTLVVPGALWLFGGPIFGWAKPVPVMKNRLNNPRYGMMAVAAAGPGMNFLLALVGAILLGILGPDGWQLAFHEMGWLMVVGPDGSMALAPTAMLFFILINLFLAIFNLLPIPPFDGGHIVEGLLPRSMAVHWAKVQQMGMLVLIVLIAATWAFPQWNIIGNTIGWPVEWALEKYLTLASAIAGGGPAGA